VLAHQERRRRSRKWFEQSKASMAKPRKTCR
jgi:hypothetical protein